MTTAEILSRLERVKKTADGWMARCPGHQDKTPSLSIKTGDDGRTLFHCQAGCRTEHVCAALGITLADLFAEKPDRNGAGKRIVATYPYHDADGKLLFEVVRFEPKDFRQRRPDSTALDGWTWNTRGVQRVLFRVPEITAAVRAGRRIYLTEGERDTLAMVEHGFEATTNCGGAGKWLDSYNETLRGADVIIIADKDPPGRKHAATVAQKLFGVAATVKITELPDTNGKPVKDAADFFAAGGEAADLDAVTEAAPEFIPSPNADAVPDADPAEVKPLPAIVDAASFLQEKIETPSELVAGVLHQGSKLAFGGGSKTFKTWTLTDLALAIAAGEPWLSFKTKKGRVLFLNFEIQPAFFQQRIRAVADVKQIALAHGMIDLWNLRGQAAGYASIFPRITERVKNAGYVLIVLDPIYKCYGDVDENSAGAVAGLMNAIEALTVETGAAVAFGAHYSKGNQAGKESIDRISGSGVFARDPDSILNFTRHEEQDAFTVELTLRNFKPVAPFCVRWSFPLMRRDDALDPAKLKQATGRPKIHTVEKILECLGTRKLNTVAWQKKAGSERGIPKTQFFQLLEQAKRRPGLTQTAQGKWFYEAPKEETP
jgi:5S rRNA maturation endonuclease (ribonuclease M5)